MNINVFYGRFQPIHNGHIWALQSLDEYNTQTGGKAYIATSATQDPESNPLSFDQKKKFIQESIDALGLDISVWDIPVMKIYDLIRDLCFECQNGGGGVVTLFCGGDRVASYQKMADGLVPKYQARGEIMDVEFKVQQAMERTDEAHAYSATQMRQHVKDGDFETFADHTILDEVHAKEMFDALAVAMGVVEDTSEKVESDPYAVTKMMAEKVAATTNQLSGEQNKLYYIGGCVRDLVAGKKPNDLDLVTTMYYRDYANLFKTPDIRFRGANIIVVPVIDGEGYETACLPKDMTLDDRIAHSDLTMNSMVQDIVTGEIYDPLGGQQDMANNILRCTDFMIDAFAKGQQPVAVLRTIRFYAINDMELDQASDDALFLFSDATKGKLKVTERQFGKDFHKVQAKGCVEKFVAKMKEVGFHDFLVKTFPEYASAAGV